MTTFIGGISALQFLVSAGTPMRHVLGSGTPRPLEPTRSAPRPGIPVDATTLHDLGFPDGIYTEKLHVNVASREMRCRSNLVVSHVWTAPDRGTYLRIDDEFCVLTPEACFAQLAAELPLPHLVELAFMLCGTYAPAPESLPTRYDVEPLTTPSRLASYVERLSGKRGLENARIATKLVTPGSGSPMESKIATMFALSTRRGGMGIPAELNREITLSQAARGLGYRNIRRPDFMWPEFHVTMDYDSSEYHDIADMVASDEARRNELSAMGLNNIVARKHHFKNYLAFEALMGQVLAAMHKPANSEVADLADRRAKLFSELFGNQQWRPMDMR